MASSEARARPPGHGRPGSDRNGAERSRRSPCLGVRKQSTERLRCTVKAASTPRCFQRTAPQPPLASHAGAGRERRGGAGDRRGRRASNHSGAGGAAGAENGDITEPGAGCGRMGAGRAGGGRMFPARRRRPPAAPRSRAEVSPRRRSLKGSRKPHRPSAGGRSGAAASAAASPAGHAEAGHALPRALSERAPFPPPVRGPGRPALPLRTPPGRGKAPGAMALPGSHAAWDGAAASVSNSC